MIVSISNVTLVSCLITLLGVSSFSISSSTRFTTGNGRTSRCKVPSFPLRNALQSKLSEDVPPVDMPVFTPEEIELKKRTKHLCEERNIPFEKIKNARDLSSPLNSIVKPGSVIRMGNVSKASKKDIEILFDKLKVKTLIDLRSPTEFKEDGTINDESIFQGFTNIVWRERDGSSTEQDGGWDKKNLKTGDRRKPVGNENRKERHFVSVMNEFKYVQGTISKLRKRDVAKALLRLKVKSVFLTEINHGGLPMLNELLLRMGGPGIKRALELISDKSRHPVCFYCTAGKDRTGVLAAIILALLDVPDESIVEDYSLSANVYAEMGDHKAMVGALSQRNLDPKTFLGAPPHVMRDTLMNLKKDYGSVEGYLDWIGFDEEDRRRLKEALTN